MSKEAKETISTIKEGKLPPLNISNNPKKGIEVNQRGMEVHKYGLRTDNTDKK